jgi:hypothetical protein
MVRTEDNRRNFTTFVPDELIARIKLASAASGRRISDIVADALDAGLPRQHLRSGEPPPRQRSAKY